MYQIEIKLRVIKELFLPSNGWDVTVHIDPSEEGKSEKNNKNKHDIAKKCMTELSTLGVKIGTHKKYGKRDLVASHPIFGTHIIEVEGISGKQKEQSFYSALSQLILSMGDDNDSIVYGIAVPDVPDWHRQLDKVPENIKAKLKIQFLVVGKHGTKKYVKKGA